ncbi:MAG TPA: GxxExxY protein [Chitinophagaceae bacterium]|nr:GxxExxY protein [Chitinophagaceae bacterium]
MIKEEYIHSDITSEILNVAFEVHKIIGPGFVESVYLRSMIVEFGLRSTEADSEIELPIYYKNIRVGSRRADLLIKKKVIVELKAVVELNDNHLAQAINYLEAFNLEVGLLINFGSKSLQYKRVIHPKLFHQKNP